MKRFAFLSMLVLPALSMVGCIVQAEEDSCNIRTPGIFNEYEVHRTSGGAEVSARFWVGNNVGGTVLNLGQCGDQIKVNGVALTASSEHWYKASVPTADVYEFTFTRENEQPYVSTVSAPQQVVITAPNGESIPRDQAFDITWENGNGGNINLEAKGDCIWSYPSVKGDLVPDTGKHTVAANTIKTLGSAGTDATCTVNIELKREIGGQLANGLKGTIKGISKGATNFTTVPAGGTPSPDGGVADSGTQDVAQEDVAQEDVAQEDAAQEDVAQEDVAQEGASPDA